MGFGGARGGTDARGASAVCFRVFLSGVDCLDLLEAFNPTRGPATEEDGFEGFAEGGVRAGRGSAEEAMG